jgi:D-glycero-D-manno-heptose 1,7-bisphosphate phosphatase
MISSRLISAGNIALLDRDGVINRDSGYTYIFSPELIYDDLAALSSAGVKDIFVFTNQSGIGRGFYSDEQFHCFMGHLRNYLDNKFNLRLVDYYYCPHRPEDYCGCRKPSPQMILSAITEHNINLKDSFFVGDKLSDIRSGNLAKVPVNFLLNRSGTALVGSESVETDCQYQKIHSLWDI